LGSFQTTYEELKLSWSLIFCHFSRKVSRLPMRNWNIFLPEKRENYPTVSRLPMRNWNCEGNGLNVHCNFSFQTTYEELKLKCEFLRLSIREKVSRLPMRNWNNFYSKQGRNSWNVSRLPMRNWNGIAMKPLRMMAQVSRLPMRNWNLTMISLILIVEVVSRLPMRNWNEQGTRWEQLISISFPDYLWGIETFFLWFFAVSIPGFPDYLWGIETCRLNGIWRFNEKFPDYLWGIETAWI